MSAAASIATPGTTPVPITVIMPGLDCAETLPACLAAIAASSVPADQLLFFDDGSRDGSGALAAAAGAQVIRNDGPPLGPGVARNRAAAAAAGQLLVFVDADVAVHPDAIGRLIRAMAGERRRETGDMRRDDADAVVGAGEAPAESAIVAAFGSYDDTPPARNLASLYMNLRHHAVHQQGPFWATTFWAGLGVVRRDAFLAAGGFAAAYGRPSIEDIELGTRLVAAGGRIRLVPEAQGTHHKHWSLVQLWRTDVFQRALPWSRLLAKRRIVATDLNAAAGERRAAVLAHLATACWPAALAWPVLALPAAVASAAYLVQIRTLLAVMRRRVPLRLLPGIVALHWAYHLYASQIFGWTLLAARWKLVRRRTLEGIPGATPGGPLHGSSRAEAGTP